MLLTSPTAAAESSPSGVKIGPQEGMVKGMNPLSWKVPRRALKEILPRAET